MMCTVRLLVPAAVLAALALQHATAGGEGFTNLFNGRDFTGWKFVFGNKVTDDPGKTFTVKEETIIVSGQPNGYMFTDKSYKNYVLRFDWRYLKPEEGKKSSFNSGLLVHIQEPHGVWPKSVEVQGANASHGNTFGIGPKGSRAEFKGKFDKAAHKEAVKAVGEWNTTEVTARDGMISTKINGIQVDSGKGELTEGPIGWQSEGAPIHFKNIKIKVLN